MEPILSSVNRLHFNLVCLGGRTREAAEADFTYKLVKYKLYGARTLVPDLVPGKTTAGLHPSATEP